MFTFESWHLCDKFDKIPTSTNFSLLYIFIFCTIIIYIVYVKLLILFHQSLIEFIIANCKRIILSQLVNFFMISVITPLLVTYVIAVVSIHMGSQEFPPIRNNLNLCYLLFIFSNKIILVLNYTMLMFSSVFIIFCTASIWLAVFNSLYCVYVFFLSLYNYLL